MRSGKELILATKTYTQEFRTKSWLETLFTLFLIAVTLASTFMYHNLLVKCILSIICGLLYVRMFVIYHDYQHHAILQKSKLAEGIMTLFGIFILAPKNIWKRSHDHHHAHNSKLTMTGIGSYPTISKAKYLSLSKKDKFIYLANRHPLTILFGYLTLFVYWLNVKSFLQSPKKHIDSLISLIFHFGTAFLVYYYFGFAILLSSWIFPFFLAFAIGSYLFYSQHNFPEASFKESQDWSYTGAALDSTSLLKTNFLMEWFTGNIGYHHVHHLNSRIPFYRLKETMAAMPELQNVKTTSFSPIDIYNCLVLKVWDNETGKMIGFKDL